MLDLFLFIIFVIHVQTVDFIIGRRRALRILLPPVALCLKASSISPSDRPLVSCMKTAPTKEVKREQPPKRKYASKLLLSNRIGVVKAIRKLKSQLLEWAKVVADARVR